MSIIAIGGATSMDTTLGLYSLVLGPANSISALISGVLLTAIIPIVIPLAIYLVPM
ncbi:MAG: LysO family transporter [Sulfolobaceae archaeon]